MIDHIAITVKKYDECKQFYTKVLKVLGFRLDMDLQIAGKLYAGFGPKGKPTFWLYKGEQTQPRVHVAFQAESRDEVNAFYAAAIKAGGIDNGKPGIREHYHPNYYGAFVIDPEGHNIEAVCHKPE
jgi:catechol 2,3-dioxygenase-like lactoylglutathione lyase family enzyme